MMVTFDKIRALAMALPAVEESTSYGTPAFKVRGKLMARLKEDHETLVLRVEWEERERLLAVFPEAYFLIEHYRAHPWVLMRLPAASAALAEASLVHAWRQSAPLSLRRPRGASRPDRPQKPR